MATLSKNKIATYLILIGISLSIYSCERAPKTKVTEEPIIEGERKLYIANEGNYGSGNASLSIYHITSAVVKNNVYKNQNGQGIGDVITDLNIIDENLWVVINNSNKIELLDTATYESKASISVAQPRYLNPINNDRILVTSMYFSKLHVVNKNSRSIEKSITFPYKHVEKLVVVGNTAFVCNWDTMCNKIYKVDINELKIVDSFEIPFAAPQDIALDNDHNLWILSGNIHQGKPSAITVTDTSGIVLKKFEFPANTDLIKLRIEENKQDVYVLGVNYNGSNSQFNGLFKLHKDDLIFPINPFIEADNMQYFWDYGIDPVTKDIYVSDPRGFIQRGDIRIYDANGNYKSSFETELGPGKLIFK